jgi:hypothetical protein
MKNMSPNLHLNWKLNFIKRNKGWVGLNFEKDERRLGKSTNLILKQVSIFSAAVAHW